MAINKLVERKQNVRDMIDERYDKAKLMTTEVQ